MGAPATLSEELAEAGRHACPGHISCSFPWMSLSSGMLGREAMLWEGLSRHMLARCPLPAWTALLPMKSLYGGPFCT